MQTNGSTASDVPVVGREKKNEEGLGGMDTFAMYDMEHGMGITEPGVVHVTSEMRWEEYMG